VFFSILWTLICGSFIGWLAGKLMHRHTSLVRNIIVGIVGSALGNFLFSLIGFHAYKGISSFLVSVVGACVLLWIVDLIAGHSR
jgi:uncharacterized membrane protein YeaQ/YmgE (transglycosylase-associated protein family)